MARSFTTDPLMSHSFALLDVPQAGGIPIAFSIKSLQDAVGSGAFIGMKSIELPSVQLELKEIKEGNWNYVHKVPTGFVDAGEVTLEMALFPWNLDMFVYFRQAMKGIFGPRRSFLVVNLKNDRFVPWRVLMLHDCVPSSWTPSSSMDASASEVLLESMVLDVHQISVVPAPIPPFPVNQIPSNPRGGQF